MCFAFGHLFPDQILRRFWWEVSQTSRFGPWLDGRSSWTSFSKVTLLQIILCVLHFGTSNVLFFVTVNLEQQSGLNVKLHHPALVFGCSNGFDHRRCNLPSSYLKRTHVCCRYAAFVEDGNIKVLNVEEVPSNFKVSDAETLLKSL